ncbi:hypothetical protein QBC47DRAFT_342319 [Echria macrotheca]|uniref:NWD NACHT-NTPase N-terminal domain-containing protein n=1 Tax=Echria macrotheca TaxID=438768 RepID=A0AAJ0BI03_9PEZI|nr:hypothetical protein QBC47DRAFT_342319 [Echria macrotheca]
MGRVRRFAAHVLHRGGDGKPAEFGTAGLVRSTLAQPVLHRPLPTHSPETGIQPADLEKHPVLVPIPEGPKPLDTPPPSPLQEDASSCRDPSIWARAFRHFWQTRPELAKHYAEHLESLGREAGDSNGAASSTTLQTIEGIVQKLQHHREQKQWKISLAGTGWDIKVREQAEKFAKFLLWSDPIVKNALSAQPYAALAWSGVSFALSLLTTGTSQHAAMLHGFDVVNNTLVYWHVCEETYLGTPDQPEHKDLVAVVTKLYSLLIEYQARAISHLSQRQLARAWEKIANGNEWVDRIRQIEAENERCRRMIDPLRERQIQQQASEQLRVMQESQVILGEIRAALDEARTQSQSRYEDKLERALLQDLASGYEGFKNLNPPRVGGTCEWFFRDQGFREWRDRSTSGVLWVSAGPGCGKSVLSRALIDEGRLSTHVTTSTVCHFFFKEGDERRTSAAAALSAIVHQLLTQSEDPNLVNDAVRRHKSYGNTLGTNVSELWQILAHHVSRPEAGEVICVLDAVDECDENDREILFAHIRALYSSWNAEEREQPSGSLKFLLTSRPHDGLDLVLRQLSETGALVHVDGDKASGLIGDEINLVIDTKLAVITAGFDAQDRACIAARLKSMQHRTYLWLHLVLDIVEKRPSRFGRACDLEEFLSTLPVAVSDAYERILGRTLEPRQTRTLLGLVLAAQRPLTVDEANMALTLALDLDRNKKPPATLQGLRPWPANRFTTVVQNLCGLLVSVTDSKLYLLHQSARDFLLDPPPSHGWQASISSAQIHETMFRVCAQYLDVSPPLPPLYWGEEYHALQQRYPFLAYAAAYWPTHYLAAAHNASRAARSDITAADEQDEEEQALSLCQPQYSRIWLPHHLQSSYLRWWTWTPVAVASYFGLAPVVARLLPSSSSEPKLDINAKCSDFGTALQTAAAGGHEAVVRLLLTHDSDAVDIASAITIAADRGHQHLVALLSGSGCSGPASCSASHPDSHHDLQDPPTVNSGGGGDSDRSIHVRSAANMDMAAMFPEPFRSLEDISVQAGPGPRLHEGMASSSSSRRGTVANADEEGNSLSSSTPWIGDGVDGTFVDMPAWDMSGISWFDDDF